MIIKDSNAKTVREQRGSSILPRWVYHFESSDYRSPDWDETTYQSMLKTQENTPVVVGKKDRRVWWLFGRNFYYEDEGHNADEVKALVAENAQETPKPDAPSMSPAAPQPASTNKLSQGEICFVCQKGKLQRRTSTWSFRAITVLKCDHCSTQYEDLNQGKYFLQGVPVSYSKWKYYDRQILSLRELNRISEGGWSDAQIAQQVKQLNLSEKAQQIITEQSMGWKSRLYAQVIIDRIEKLKTLSQQGQTANTSATKTVEVSQLRPWVSDRLGEFQNIVNQLSILVNSNPEVGKIDNPTDIVGRSLKIFSFYIDAIRWSRTVRNTPVDSSFADIPDKLASYSTAITEGIEQFGHEILDQVQDAINNEYSRINVVLNVKVPDEVIERLTEGLKRLKLFVGLGAFVGQESVVEKVKFQIQLAKKQGTSLKHILICAPDGEGKKFLAKCIANEMEVSGKVVEADNLRKPGDLTATLTNMRAGDILFIEHIERLNPPCAEVLAPAMTDFTLDMSIGKGPSARQIRLKMPHFTLVGTAPNQGAVRELLRNSFDVVLDFAPYDQKSLATVILMATRDDKSALDTSGATEIAKRANGSLRAARKLARQVRDYAVVNNHNIVDEEVVLKAFGVFGVDNERTGKDKTGVAFELKCMNLLRRRNFEVSSTKRTSDGGIDLVASSTDPFVGGKYVIQCKDWSNPVGAPVVRDLYGVVHAENANKGILIAASSFTPEALDFAAGKRLELIDGKKLNYLLAQ